MDSSCDCQQTSLDFTEYEELGKITTPVTQFETIIIDFGKAAVHRDSVRTITLFDDDLKSNEVISYSIRRESAIKPIYQVFDFQKYEGYIKPRESLTLKVKYTPQIPYQKNLDTFVLEAGSFIPIKIITKGDSKGPALRTSVKRLTFFKSCAKCKKTFEINNISDVPAEFVFDCNEKGDIFTVEPMKGTVQGLSHIYVDVYFYPKEYGLFSQKLFCLTWCDTPLGIDLFGVYTKNYNIYDTQTSSFKNYPFPFEETVGYDAYFQETTNKKEQISVFLSSLYIDFKRKLKDGDEMYSNNQTISITNFTSDNITVRWPEDEVFKVVPKCTKIMYNDTVPFECHFNPKEKSAFYNKIMTAQIDWISYHTSPEKEKKTTVYIPITVCVRFQGHSFPVEEGWIPNVEIYPFSVILPPCLPGYTSSSNFKICSKGHLPVMYRLLAPKKTNIVMKPMAGLIISYAVITVQLYTKKDQQNEIFNEQWYIELNGRKERRLPVCIEGEIGVPEIQIGTNNYIRFEPVQPKCETTLLAPMKNVSSFQICYEFEIGGYDCIQIEPMTGELRSNEEIQIKFTYTGNTCAPNKFSLRCKIQTIQKIEELVGEHYEHSFDIYTKCVYSQLSATPGRHHFGNCSWDSFLETEFYLFNFGESTVNFRLIVSFYSYNKSGLKVKPREGEVEPGDKMKISIGIRAKTVGTHKVKFLYGVRKSKESKEMTSDNFINLSELYYRCSYPKIKIQEIVDHNFGPLFTKMHFWRQYLQIPRLNKILRTMKHGETKQIYMKMPDFEVSQALYYVTLLVKNVSLFEMDVHLKRKQMCQCPLKEVPGHINIRKMAFDCPHREMLTMEFSDTKFYVQTEQFLTFQMKYTVPGETIMGYVLQLGCDRTIEIIFTIFTIPDDTLHISFYQSKCHMLLKNVSVCRRVAPIQTFWLYNNTQRPTAYKLDETELKALCRKKDFEIFKCINPEGEIESYSALPLMIKFHPIEIKKYNVTVRLMLGDNMFDFPIYGAADMKALKNPFPSSMPEVSKRVHNFPVTLSSDYITIDCLPVWSTTKRIVFIKNVSTNKIIQYSWGDATIDEVLKITTITRSGMLKPKESHPIIIKIKTFNEACITDILLTCKMLDYVQFVLYRRSLEFYNIRQKQVEEEFTVTEEGNYHEPNEIIVADMPEVLTITLPINVNIIHTKDQDEYMTLKEQFVSTPQNDIEVNIADTIKTCFPLSKSLKNEKHKLIEHSETCGKDRIKIILEELITDFIFGNSFKEMFKIAHNQQTPFYTQFTMEVDDFFYRKSQKKISSDKERTLVRKNIVRKVFSRPKLTTVAKTFNELITDSIQGLFKLGKPHVTEREIDKEVEKILHICPTLPTDECEMD